MQRPQWFSSVRVLRPTGIYIKFNVSSPCAGLTTYGMHIKFIDNQLFTIDLLANPGTEPCHSVGTCVEHRQVVSHQ